MALADLTAGCRFDSNRILTAIGLANRRVFRVGESREDYTGMGSTVVAMLIQGDRLSFASVGDSRLYSLSGGSLVQLTEDDTWVAITGAIDPNTAATHPMRHVLTNVIGARDQIECRVSENVISGDETFLLSTDGLHGALTPAILDSMLRTDSPPDIVADRLVQAALEHGGGDNITAVVVRCRPQGDER